MCEPTAGKDAGKCTFYGKQVTTPGGATLPGLCFANEFLKEGNNDSVRKEAGKAARAAADHMVAKRDIADAAAGRNISLGGGGGGGSGDPRTDALAAGTAELARMARAAQGLAGGAAASAPYGEESHRWAL